MLRSGRHPSTRLQESDPRLPRQQALTRVCRLPGAPVDNHCVQDALHNKEGDLYCDLGERPRPSGIEVGCTLPAGTRWPAQDVQVLEGHTVQGCTTWLRAGGQHAPCRGTHLLQDQVPHMLRGISAAGIVSRAARTFKWFVPVDCSKHVLGKHVLELVPLTHL